jgi:hypothetical protein
MAIRIEAIATDTIPEIVTTIDRIMTITTVHVTIVIVKFRYPVD